MTSTTLCMRSSLMAWVCAPSTCRPPGATTVLRREAFQDAADPTKYPDETREGLRPWQPRKLYFSANAPGGGRGGAQDGRGGDARGGTRGGRDGGRGGNPGANANAAP